MHVSVGGSPAKSDVSTDVMAVPAVDAVVADMVLVAEWNRLVLATSTPVVKAPAFSRYAAHTIPQTASSAATMLTFAMLFALR